MSATELALDDLIALRQTVTANHESVTGNSPWAGRFRGLRRGQGMDFDDLRPYVAGDDVRHIDWKASARLGTTYSRVYREEKEHAVTMVLDLRDSMYTGSRDLRAVQAAYVLTRRLWQAAESGSRIAVAVLDRDGVSFSDRAAGEQGALAGCTLVATRFAACAKALDQRNHQTEETSSSEAPGLDTLAERCATEGRRLGTLLFVTGLDDQQTCTPEVLATSLRRLQLIVSTHLVLIRDPIEKKALPQGRYRYRSRISVQQQTDVRHVHINRHRQQQIDTFLEQQQRSLDDICKHCGIDLEWIADADT